MTGTALSLALETPGFAGVLGQPTAVATLERALRSGRMHHAYLFEGPGGVGKETAALCLARALVCENPETLGCGKCSACRRAQTLAEEAPQVPLHPDVVLVERGLYPANLLGGGSEATGISVEQVRRIVLSRVGFPPHEGRCLCILIRRADELTPSAANALLKTLEEPPPRTVFVLLTSRPGRLLDTIRSRTLPVRFGPLPSAVVRQILAREGLPGDVAEEAGGSLARARALAEPDVQAKRQAFVDAADRALSAPHAAAALDFAEERPEARDDLLALLAHLGEVYAKRARLEGALEVFAARFAIVQKAIGDVERNASPALTLESMMLSLRAVR